MKTLFKNILKTLLVFDLPIIIISLIPWADFKNDSYLKLFDMAAFSAIILAFSLFSFFVIEKKNLNLPIKTSKKNCIFGILIGLVIPILNIALISVFKSFNMLGFNKTQSLVFWISALLFETLAAALLYRGYLFCLYKKHYGFIAATVITLLLYISYNLLIFQKGIIFVLNSILLFLLLALLTEITDSLLVPFATHFVYSFLCKILIGSKNINAEYPSIINTEFSGKAVLSGGQHGIEGSIITTVILSIIILILIQQKYDILGKLKEIRYKRKFKKIINKKSPL